MVDGTVRIAQQSPGDRLIDNEVVNLGAGDVYRQRVVALGAGGGPVSVVDDFTDFQVQHVTLVPSTDTTITFTGQVRFVQVHNWDTGNRLLVKNAAIASDTDAAAARIGRAPAAEVPSKLNLPYRTTSVHLRSAAASEVTVIGYP